MFSEHVVLAAGENYFDLQEDDALRSRRYDEKSMRTFDQRDSLAAPAGADPSRSRSGLLLILVLAAGWVGASDRVLIPSASELWRTRLKQSLADIRNGRVMAVLEQGVPRFLQKVLAEPHLSRGRFMGWRLVSLFSNDPGMTAGVLRVGDTVLSVNGQSIERPEQFKNVWDSLATSSELVFKVRRGDQPSTVRYAIVD